jgi:hypothetical protein
MKLSENTVGVLKNFATINSGIQIKAGSTIRTISKQQNVLAKATVSENFDSEFVIYDLNRFLALITSLDAPEISINTEKKNLMVKSGSSKTTYGLSDESMIVAPPNKELKLENAEVNFKLTKEDFNQVMKLSGILGLPNIAVVGDGKNISISTLDVKNDESDSFSIKVGETEAKFKMIFATENLKMVTGNYDVSISSKGFAHFKNEKDPIEYWVALESGSKYEG